MQEGSFGFLDSALHTADHVIAGAEWSKPIVAIGDEVGHRYRLRLLLLKSRDPVVESLSFGGMFRSQSLLYSPSINIEAAFNDLRCQQLLTRSPFIFGFLDRTLNIFRVFPECFRLQFFPIRRLALCTPLPQRFDLSIDFRNLIVIGAAFLCQYTRVGLFDF